VKTEVANIQGDAGIPGDKGAAGAGRRPPIGMGERPCRWCAGAGVDQSEPSTARRPPGHLQDVRDRPVPGKWRPAGDQTFPTVGLGRAVPCRPSKVASRATPRQEQPIGEVIGIGCEANARSRRTNAACGAFCR
jgi:hypothetical protein